MTDAFEGMPPVSREQLHERCTKSINEEIQSYKTTGAMKNAKGISDGYHTFEELYEFRAVLNIALFKALVVGYKATWKLMHMDTSIAGSPGPWHNEVWRSKLHSDGTMFDGMFIFGVFSEPGKQITFHYHLDKWNDCAFAETLDKAPEWDGHTPADVLERLKAL